MQQRSSWLDTCSSRSIARLGFEHRVLLAEALAPAPTVVGAELGREPTFNCIWLF